MHACMCDNEASMLWVSFLQRDPSYCRHIETNLCVKKPESISAEEALGDHKHVEESIQDFSVINSHLDCSDFDSHWDTDIPVSEQE